MKDPASTSAGHSALQAGAQTFTLSRSRRTSASPIFEDPCCATGVCAASGVAPAIVKPALPSSQTKPGAADDCCSGKAHEIAALGQVAGVKRVLQIVLAINLAMFFIEFTAGVVANSTALMADSVDMLGDALVYVLSLHALDRGLRWRAGAALAKGGLIALFGVWVFVEAALKLVNGVTPTAPLMAAFGALALAANLTCLVLLYHHRARDVNLSSTFECSRNDVIANTGVLIAAGGVSMLNAAWPDILVGVAIGALFFRSAIGLLRGAWPQFRATRPTVAVEFD